MSMNYKNFAANVWFWVLVLIQKVRVCAAVQWGAAMRCGAGRGGAVWLSAGWLGEAGGREAWRKGWRQGGKARMGAQGGGRGGAPPDQ